MNNITGLALSIVMFSSLFAISASAITLKAENIKLNQVKHQQSLELKQIQHTNEVLVKLCSAQYRE